MAVNWASLLLVQTRRDICFFLWSGSIPTERMLAPMTASVPARFPLRPPPDGKVRDRVRLLH